MIHFALVIFIVVSVSDAIKLPDYIRPCSRKMNFDECALESAKYAIPFIVEGDKALKIPPMKPLNVPLVELNAQGNFNLKIKDMNVYGLERTEPVSLKTDFDKQFISLVTRLDNITFIGDYEINGKVLILPVEGRGPVRISLYGGEYRFNFHYNLFEREGKRYAKLDKEGSEFVYDLARVEYRFENLFNGDKRLGEEMNKFLNENWREVDRDLKGSISEAFLEIYSDLSEKFYSKIPYDELFLD